MNDFTDDLFGMFGGETPDEMPSVHDVAEFNNDVTMDSDEFPVLLDMAIETSAILMINLMNLLKAHDALQRHDINQEEFLNTLHGFFGVIENIKDQGDVDKLVAMVLPQKMNYIADQLKEMMEGDVSDIIDQLDDDDIPDEIKDILNDKNIDFKGGRTPGS